MKIACTLKYLWLACATLCLAHPMRICHCTSDTGICTVVEALGMLLCGLVWLSMPACEALAADHHD